MQKVGKPENDQNLTWSALILNGSVYSEEFWYIASQAPFSHSVTDFCDYMLHHEYSTMVNPVTLL